jgi:hypothetical protein
MDKSANGNKVTVDFPVNTSGSRKVGGINWTFSITAYISKFAYLGQQANLPIFRIESHFPSRLLDASANSEPNCTAARTLRLPVVTI